MSLPVLDERPQTRGECVDGPRPCPWVSCKYHMAWMASGDDHRRLMDDDDDAIVETIAKMKDSCVLDVADRGGLTLAQVGEIVGVTRERVRQIVTTAMRTGERRNRRLRIVNQKEDL